MNDIETNLQQVQDQIRDTATRVGRDPAEIRLLPVSKTVSEERIRLAVAAGCSELGENKIQEANRKARNLADLDVRWSIIGHLQTNKAKDVVRFAHEFQALHSHRVAQTLDRRLQAAGRSLDVFVQVNTSGEESKYGLTPEETLPFLKELPDYASLRVRGLMTLAVFSDDTARVRKCFRTLRQVRDAALQEQSVGEGELSMGMSADFLTAIEEGATCVRVGQAIFGPRPLPDSHYWPGM